MPPRTWTPEDDAFLIEAVNKTGSVQGAAEGVCARFNWQFPLNVLSYRYNGIMESGTGRRIHQRSQPHPPPPSNAQPLEVERSPHVSKLMSELSNSKLRSDLLRAARDAVQTQDSASAALPQASAATAMFMPSQVERRPLEVVTTNDSYQASAEANEATKPGQSVSAKEARDSPHVHAQTSSNASSSTPKARRPRAAYHEYTTDEEELVIKAVEATSDFTAAAQWFNDKTQHNISRSAIRHKYGVLTSPDADKKKRKKRKLAPRSSTSAPATMPTAAQMPQEPLAAQSSQPQAFRAARPFNSFACTIACRQAGTDPSRRTGVGEEGVGQGADASNLPARRSVRIAVAASLPHEPPTLAPPSRTTKRIPHKWTSDEESLLLQLAAASPNLELAAHRWNHETRNSLSVKAIKLRHAKLTSAASETTAHGASNAAMDVDEEDEEDSESDADAASDMSWSPEEHKELSDPSWLPPQNEELSDASWSSCEEELSDPEYSSGEEEELSDDEASMAVKPRKKTQQTKTQQTKTQQTKTQQKKGTPAAPHRWSTSDEEVLVRLVKEKGSAKAATPFVNAALGLTLSDAAVRHKYRKLTCSKEDRLKRKQYQDNYNKTPKARAARKAYALKLASTPNGRAIIKGYLRKYRSSPKGKAAKSAANKRFRASAKGKVARRRYERKDSYKARRRTFMRLYMRRPHVKAKFKQYLKSPAGQAMLRRKELRRQLKRSNMTEEERKAEQAMLRRKELRRQLKRSRMTVEERMAEGERKKAQRGKKRREAEIRATLPFCKQKGAQ